MDTQPQNNQMPVSLNICSLAPAQIRAARGMLGWTRRELAKRTNLSPETIKNTEHGTYTPKEETIKAFIDVFAQSGLQFVSHETNVITHTEGGVVTRTIKLSYSGMVCVTASPSDVQGGTKQ